MATATMTAPDLTEQITQARRNAADLRTEFDRTEGELAQAVEALDYERANTLKQRADELRPSVILAENNLTALERTAQALADHGAEVHREQREKERQEAAQAALSEFAAADRAAVAECESALAKAREHIAAARACLVSGLAAQDRATAARMGAYQVELDAGLVEPSPFGAAPAANHVSAAIEASPMLAAIFRSAP